MRIAYCTFENQKRGKLEAKEIKSTCTFVIERSKSKKERKKNNPK